MKGMTKIGASGPAKPGSAQPRRAPKYRHCQTNPKNLHANGENKGHSGSPARGTPGFVPPFSTRKTPQKPTKNPVFHTRNPAHAHRLLALLLCSAALACAASPPQRIVSLSPDLTEILYGVGAFPRVVGVSNYDTYPPEAARLPHLGQLQTPAFEQLAALRPDLVLINNAQAPFLEQTLKDLGLPVLEAANQTVQQVYTAMMIIGRAVGHESEAAKLVASTREGLDRVARRTAALPKTRVVLIIDRTPGTLRDLYTATDGSYLAELVAMAGGKIALAPVEHGYRKLSKEDLLAANPEVILDFVQASKGQFTGNKIEAWNDMPELKAVRTHRVYEVDEDYVPHASQRMVQTAELFARLIHSEQK
jgi:iron complex transport system substrate-binding protein